ncbi:hemolysin III family protein [Roseovarius sp.]|jgi:hemolysin III|uniref:PAQR family membrane homeostasis protein TrhA n=1 Tax=Roseovarius sp. TaxID=1486281 RepID=UPI00262DF564|nr:hemolysin III family protein [Roseovarius sp.]MDM8168106.1 hemolysin III family protein [Roseovarius sp.]
MSYPNYTRAERWADGIVHVTGVTAALAGVATIFWMWYQHMPWSTFVATSVYAAGLILMLSASAAYHLGAHTAARPILRRIDHAAIYLKIAGTFTPLSVLLGTAFGYIVLGLVWLLALVGAGAKLMAARGAMTTGWWPQVALGWIGVALIVPLWTLLPPQSLWLILTGGIIYSVAVIFYCWETLRYANAIWHAFVLVATGCFFMGISAALASAVQIPL